MKVIVIKEESKNNSITGVLIGFKHRLFKPMLCKVRLCTGEVINVKPEDIKAYE